MGLQSPVVLLLKLGEFRADSFTGLDADATGFASFKGFPDLPVATCKIAISLKDPVTYLEQTLATGLVALDLAASASRSMLKV